MAGSRPPRVSVNAKSRIALGRITIGPVSRTLLLWPPIQGEERAVREILKNFINGHWESGVTTGTSENPSDCSAPVADYARADARPAEAPAEAAGKAGPGGRRPRRRGAAKFSTLRPARWLAGKKNRAACWRGK